MTRALPQVPGTSGPVQTNHLSNDDPTDVDRTSYWLIDDPYHYIDIDRLSTRPGSDGDQNVPSRGYEGLDPDVLPVLRQGGRPGEYAGLVAAQEPAEHVDMNRVDTDDNSRNAVSRLLVRYDTIR